MSRDRKLIQIIVLIIIIIIIVLIIIIIIVLIIIIITSMSSSTRCKKLPSTLTFVHQPLEDLLKFIV